MASENRGFSAKLGDIAGKRRALLEPFVLRRRTDFAGLRDLVSYGPEAVIKKSLFGSPGFAKQSSAEPNLQA